MLEDFLTNTENNELTHNTDVLRHKGERLEFGIHPNFNSLLIGDNSDENYSNVLKNIRKGDYGSIYSSNC